MLNFDAIGRENTIQKNERQRRSESPNAIPIRTPRKERTTYTTKTPAPALSILIFLEKVLSLLIESVYPHTSSTFAKVKHPNLCQKIHHSSLHIVTVDSFERVTCCVSTLCLTQRRVSWQACLLKLFIGVQIEVV